MNVIWRNEKNFADEITVEYPNNEQSYTNLVSRIKDRVILKLKINENSKIIVREITFTGNNAFDRGDLRGAMNEIEESKWWKFWSSAKFDRKEV